MTIEAGSKVRLKRDLVTLGGVKFAEGELVEVTNTYWPRDAKGPQASLEGESCKCCNQGRRISNVPVEDLIEEP